MIIAIEGGDQAGKLTQSRMLEEALSRDGKNVRRFDFPDYATPVGEMIRGYLEGAREMPPQLIHCLLSANRWEKLPEIADAADSVVIMNRYTHSNVVYGMAHGLERAWLENLDAGLPEPKLVILLDITREESFRRQREDRDRFEDDLEFFQKMTAGYREMAKELGWAVIDASLPKEEVHARVLEACRGAMP